MRIGVIGAGIVGANVAWHLQERGVEVLLIDAAQPGSGVTNWTFSWVNASNKTETREYFDLNAAGISAYRDLAARIGSGDWWHPTGHLRWCDEKSAADDLRRTVAQLIQWGYDASIWASDKVRRLLEPNVLFPSADSEIAIYGDEGWVEGKRFVELLVEDIVANGSRVYFGHSAIDIVTKGNRVSELVLSNSERIPVDSVVNAAGPAGSDIAQLVGRSLPMKDEPGFICRLRSDRVPISRAMHSPHVELRPDAPGQLLLHSREIDALIGAGPSDADLTDRLKQLAVKVVPSLEAANVVATKIAWRPIPIDGFPSVGPVPGVDGYFEAITHSGITLGPIVGRLLASEILDQTVDDLLEPYRPSRFH